MTRDYHTLDAIVVVGCIFLLGAIAAALVFIDIPQPNLPILASLASGTFGLTLGLYAGARWGNNQNARKAAAEGDGTITVNGDATLNAAPTDPAGAAPAAKP